MSLPLVFQAGVRDEIDEAYAWYEEQRQGLGEDFLAAIQVVLDRIVSAPEIHAPFYQAVRHSRLKRFPYAVYYRIEPDRIAVIAVHQPQQAKSQDLAIQGLTRRCTLADQSRLPAIFLEAIAGSFPFTAAEFDPRHAGDDPKSLQDRGL